MNLGGLIGGFGSTISSGGGTISNKNSDVLEVTTNKLDILGDGSCIACYLLDGDATDLSGNYDMSGGSYVSGKFGDCLNNSIVHNPSWGLEEATKLSISLWIKRNNSDDLTIVYLGANGDNPVVCIQTSKTYVEGDGDQTDYYYYTLPDDGAFHFLTLTLDYDNSKLNLYLDGLLILADKDLGNNTKMGDISNTDSGFCSNYNADVQNIKVEQVRIFNKALTADEVYKIYKENEAPKLPTTDGLVAHYPLTGTAEDTTGNYNGTENSNTYELQSDGSVAAVFTDDTDIDSNYKIELKDTDFSMSIWLKKITGDTEYYVGTSIWGASNRVDDSNGVGWNFMINSDNFVKILHSNGNDAYNTDIGTVKIPNDGNFYHVYLSYTHSDNKTVVIINNGDSETLTVNQDITKDTSRSFHIGSTSVDTDGKSKIRDVRFYNRALTQEEITNIYLYEKNHRNIAVTNGLIAYYPLHNNSMDNWYNQFDGSDHGNVSYDGLSLSSPTHDDYVNCGSGLADNVLTDSNVVTMCAWFNFSDMSTLAGRQFQIQANGSSNSGIAISYNGDIGKISANSGGGNDNKAGVAMDSTLENNTWYHILITSDGDGTAIYLNGVLENTDDTVMYDIKTGDTTKMLGDTSYDNDQRYCSNARVYNRVISEQEVNDIYNTEKLQFGL